MPSEISVVNKLNSSQREFVKHVSLGRDISHAAELAGYAKSSANREAWRLMQQPAILLAIHVGVAQQLSAAAPMALKLLQDTVSDTKADPRLRVVCAKTILDRAGHIAPKAAAPGAAGALPLNEMSMADLRALADKLEGELAGRAKEVTSATAAPRKAQTIEDII